VANARKLRSLAQLLMRAQPVAQILTN
jgi:hypothetical protein